MFGIGGACFGGFGGAPMEWVVLGPDLMGACIALIAVIALIGFHAIEQG